MRNSLSVAVLARVFANLVGVATSFISIRIYSQYVAKEIYGVISVALVIIAYLPIMSSGFRMVINQRMLAEPDLEKSKEIARFGQLLQTYFLGFVIVGALLVMAVYSQAPKTRELHIPLAVFLATGLAATCTFQAGSQLGLLVAFGEQVASTLLQSMWGVLGLLILWLGFRAGLGVWSFPLSIGIGALLTIMGVHIVLWKTGKIVPILIVKRDTSFQERFKSVFRPALDSLSSQIGTALIFNADIIMIGILVGPGDAAVYGLVTRITGLSRQVLQSLSEAAWPRLTQESDHLMKAGLMRKVDRLNAWAVGCWYGAMVTTILPFLGSLVKGDWIASPLLTDIIVARSFMISLVSPHAYGLMSAGRFKQLAHLAWQEASVGIVLGIILSCTSGVLGTAVAYLIASCVMTAWQLTREYFREAHDTHWVREWIAVWWRGLAGIAISLGLALVVWPLIKTFISPAGWMAIIAGGVSFGVPMAIVLFFWKWRGRVP